ncbi:MAG TPA: glycine cleavage system protein GcvH [Chloroflexota bacterium]|nr:glycine cleavage system protein GcvH [Chloroflexota bacterium]
MADFPDDLRYTTSDEWVRLEGDEMVSGITAYAAEQLGDIVYVKLPEAGQQIEQSEPYGEIESVKAVSDLKAPLSGEVTVVNADLDQNPAVINDDPYGQGWIFRFRPSNPGQYDSLLTAEAYEAKTKEG